MLTNPVVQCARLSSARICRALSGSAASARLPRHIPCRLIGKTSRTHWKPLPQQLYSTAAAQVSEAQATDDGSSAVVPAVVPEWVGLRAWRNAGVDVRRHWVNKGCVPASPETPAALAADQIQLPDTLAACATLVLRTADPDVKAALSHRIWKRHVAEGLPIGEGNPPDTPARPALPQLVPARLVPTAKQAPFDLNVYMLLSLAHVELNAVDLAWDTVARFAHLQLPQAFYTDFAHVADDESRHFCWCNQRLQVLGHQYGELPAHDLLWQGAQASSGDLTARLAIVPMAQESRGLDAGPRLVQRLNSYNDHSSAALVEMISLQEKAHVGVGVAWFQRIAMALGIDAGSCYRSWLSSLCPDLASGRMNHDSRIEVGLQRSWYDAELWPDEISTPVSLPHKQEDLKLLRIRLEALLTDCSEISCM